MSLSPDVTRLGRIVAEAEVRDAVEQCRQVLLALVNSTQVEDTNWTNARLVDFDLWTVATGAIATDENGLCHRLRFHPATLRAFTTLLTSLNAALRRYHFLATGNHADEPKVDDIESSPESSCDGYMDDSDVVEQDSLIGTQREVEALIHCLIDFGAAVRKAGYSSRTSKADAHFDQREYKELREHLRVVLLAKSADDKFEERKAYENFEKREGGHQLSANEQVERNEREPGINKELDSITLRPAQTHIIEANLRRRHRYTWAKHRADSIKSSSAPTAKPGPKAPVKSERSTSIPVPEGPLGSQIASLNVPALPLQGQRLPVSTIQSSQLPENTIPVITSSKLDSKTQSQQARSAKNTAITARTSYPKGPKKARKDDQLMCACPCCQNILSASIVRKPESWKQHLVQDIQPYTCPFDDCATPYIFYSKKSDLVEHWGKHISTSPEWRCGLCVGELFDQEISFKEHLRQAHADVLLDEDLPAMVATSRIEEMLIPTECPVCLVETQGSAAEKVDHICTCLHDFSLRSLPWNDGLPKAESSHAMQAVQRRCETCVRRTQRNYEHDFAVVDRNMSRLEGTISGPQAVCNCGTGHINPDPRSCRDCRLSYVHPGDCWIEETFRLGVLGALMCSEAPKTPPPPEDEEENTHHGHIAFAIPDPPPKRESFHAPMKDEEYFDQSSATEDGGGRKVTKQQLKYLEDSLTGLCDFLSDLGNEFAAGSTVIGSTPPRSGSTDHLVTADFIKEFHKTLEALGSAIERSHKQANHAWLAVIYCLAESLDSEQPEALGAPNDYDGGSSPNHKDDVVADAEPLDQSDEDNRASVEDYKESTSEGAGTRSTLEAPFDVVKLMIANSNQSAAPGKQQYLSQQQLEPIRKLHGIVQYALKPDVDCSMLLVAISDFRMETASVLRAPVISLASPLASPEGNARRRARSPSADPQLSETVDPDAMDVETPASSIANAASGSKRTKLTGDERAGMITMSQGRVHPGNIYGTAIYGNVHHNSYGQQTPTELLLNSLSFPGMYRYQERPLESFKGTYEWIFDDNSVEHSCQKCASIPRASILADVQFHDCREAIDCSKFRYKEAAKFRSWLRTSQEIFWVSGKAGSGKSCLMKFILEHQRTVELLREWAGRQVILAGFFFWAAGGELETSHAGLFRGLLHQILSKQPELAETLMKSNKDFADDKRPWTLRRLQEALHIIITSADASASFVFFIDGLDEFQGDMQDLLEALNTVNRSKNIKLCVSSRPWNVFENAVGLRANQLHLRLHELNRLDIELYIQQKLIGDLESRKDNAYDLVEAVRDKAEGVFLWVSLAVKGLRRSMEDMWSVSETLKSLDEIPPELEDLIQKIFDSIDSAHHQNASRTFLLLLECGTERFGSQMRSQLPLLWLAMLIKDKEGNSNEPATREECSALVIKAGQAARRWCRDLVDVVCRDPLTGVRDHDDFIAAEMDLMERHNFVQFSHFTLRSFIWKRKMDGTLTRMASGDGEFCPAFALCSIIAQLPPYVCRARKSLPNLGLSFAILSENVNAAKNSSLVEVANSFNTCCQGLRPMKYAPRHWALEQETLFGELVGRRPAYYELGSSDDTVIFMAYLLYNGGHRMFWLMFYAMPQCVNTHSKIFWLSVLLDLGRPGSDQGYPHIPEVEKPTDRGRLESLSRLLQSGVDLNASARNGEDYDFRHASLWEKYLMKLYWEPGSTSGDLDMMDVLLQFGAAPNTALPSAWLKINPGSPEATIRQQDLAASASWMSDVVPATSAFDYNGNAEMPSEAQTYFPIIKARLCLANGDTSKTWPIADPAITRVRRVADRGGDRARPMKQLECHEYTVGWICPIEIEYSASSFILDEEHDHPNIPTDDQNQYICGQINGKKNVTYNVVIGCFPSGYQGTVASGALAFRMAQSFKNLQLNLLVGIGGGVPNPKDIRLGDVVVAQPIGEHGGVVQYDLGKDTVSGFKRKGILLPPPTSWLSALNRMKRDHRRQGNRVSEYLEAMFKSYPKLRKSYGRPAEDILFESDYPHPEGNKSCKGCDPTRVVPPREKRDEPDEPVIHYGLVASGNAVMKNAEKRDTISKELGGADCFEMEAAGLATDTSDFRCIVIRGVSDYADSHKNDDWHGYAAAAAAAVAKELLTCMPVDVTKVASGSSASEQASNNLSGSGSSHTWQEINAQGNARVQHGHVYGNVVYNEGDWKYPSKLSEN